MNYKILDEKLKIASFSGDDLSGEDSQVLNAAVFYGSESQYIFLNEKFSVYDSLVILVFYYMQSDTAAREEAKAFFKSCFGKKVLAVLDLAIKDRVRKIAES